MTAETVTLLMIDDDEVDVETVKRSLIDMRISNPIRVAKDGLEGLDILRGKGGHTKLEPPYLILLDINMPRMNGLEFLAEVRSDPELHKAIVFVLTTSNQDRDRIQAYEFNVAGYVLKTNAGEDFEEALRLLDHYWRYVEFPEVS